MSRATIFASIGGKLAILKAAYDVAVVGDQAPVPLVQRPRSQRILRQPDARRMLGDYALLATEICGRVARIYEALRGAATADPDARILRERVRAERRIGASNLVSAVRRNTPLKPGLAPEAAADLVWILNDPSLYHQLVIERGWAPIEFSEWLAEALQTQLLAGRAPSAKS